MLQATDEQVAGQLELAITEMKSASQQLAKAKLVQGQEHEDAALSYMLQAREHLVRVLQQSQQRSNPSPSPPSLKPQISESDLAKQAEELARKEREVQAQTALALEQPSIPADVAKELNTRQEEVVNKSHILLSDMQEQGRLPSDVVDFARQIDTSVVESFQRMMDGQYRGCAATLKDDARDFSRLAQLLRGLDPQNVAETLAEASRMSKRAAEQMTQVCQQCRSGGASNGGSSATAQQEQPKTDPSDGRPREQQQAPATDQQEYRTEQARTLADVSRDAATISQWIGHLRQSESLEPNLLDRLADVSRDVDLDKLPLDVDLAHQLDQQRRESQSLPVKEDVAGRLGLLAGRLQREAERLTQGQLARLAEADSLARQLQERTSPTPAARAASSATNPGTSRYASATTVDLRADLVEALEDFDDEILHKLAQQLMTGRSAPPAPSSSRLAPPRIEPIQLNPPRAERVGDIVLNDVRQRLATLMEQILKQQLAVAELEDAVPDGYRNLIDRYLQTLSDDLE